MRPHPRFALAFAAAVVASASSVLAQAQTPKPVPPASPPAAVVPDRVRLVLNAAFWPTKTSYSDSQTLTEYAEQTTIRTSYEGARLRPDSVGRACSGARLLVGYYAPTRRRVDVSRPTRST
jgi:hypothetical protein